MRDIFLEESLWDLQYYQNTNYCYEVIS